MSARPPDGRLAPGGRFDVLISGAGLAGGALALLLANQGLRVALADPARFPREKLCGEFLSPECWGVFDRLGLTGAIEGVGYHPIRRVRVTTPRGRVLESEFTGPDGRPGIGLSRGALDDLIVRRARAAGVEVMEETRVKGPIVEDGRVVGAVVRCGSDPPGEVRGAVTVAAEGRHSPLVRQTGVTRARSRLRPRLFGLKCHLRLDGADAGPPGTVGLHLLRGGYVGACEVGRGRTNLCGIMPEALVKRHRGDLDRLADEVFPGNPALGRLWRAARPADGWKSVADVRVVSSTPSLPGILYVGDSRGTIDPLGGQGMVLALLGAEMLAPFVKRALARGTAESDIQRDWAVGWHRRFDYRIRLCRLFHHLLVNPWVVDAASGLSALAPRLLALGYRQTREPGRPVRPPPPV